jgi:hypothetical protein
MQDSKRLLAFSRLDPDAQREIDQSIGAGAACIEEARSLKPAGVIICHGGVYRDAANAMRVAGLPLLHDRLIPFPPYQSKRRFPRRCTCRA